MDNSYYVDFARVFDSGTRIAYSRFADFANSKVCPWDRSGTDHPRVKGNRGLKGP